MLLTCAPWLALGSMQWPEATLRLSTASFQKQNQAARLRGLGRGHQSRSELQGRPAQRDLHNLSTQIQLLCG